MTPTITSFRSFILSAVAIGSISDTTCSLSWIMPEPTMFNKENTLVILLEITVSFMWSNVFHPDPPASSIVVVPKGMQSSSG
ncbi:uncharacterized protein METZ01_LOCUS407087 [marine metagenome]|uniref:Uncharacterized protein n=1 Tax=marine metagenome TaxID=408172 RepID=A0A382W621_9ZZZZ